ncbi:MAG: hypothetical protein MSIBF_01120 [Candidatus Altiarchaeales archaeon IMC4]|nr:MAG: hypothetical protein MSIBF_01120 [Candidatus Altiarchaeales archaeon IMC4]
MLYLLDTCIYGVLVDKGHKEYTNVRKILDYAKKHGDKFVTTFIIANELDDMMKEHKDIVLPVYYATAQSMIEHLIGEKVKDVRNLAWRYIQELKIDDAEKVFPDAENYSWACHAKIDAFVTINRRGVLSKHLQPRIKRINEEAQVRYVEITTPTEFLGFLASRTP